MTEVVNGYRLFSHCSATTFCRTARVSAASPRSPPVADGTLEAVATAGADVRSCSSGGATTLSRSACRSARTAAEAEESAANALRRRANPVRSHTHTNDKQCVCV